MSIEFSFAMSAELLYDINLVEHGGYIGLWRLEKLRRTCLEGDIVCGGAMIMTLIDEVNDSKIESLL